MMAQDQTHLQGDRWPRGAAMATAAQSTSGALMEKARERSPAKGRSGRNTNISSSAVKISMDEKLCRQIQKVLGLPDGSQSQKEEMDKLLRLIPNLPGIYKSLTPTIDQQDALNRALVDVSGCKKKERAGCLRGFVEKRNLNLADLVLPEIGSIECRSLLPGETEIYLPPEATENRIGCEAVENRARSQIITALINSGKIAQEKQCEIISLKFKFIEEDRMQLPAKKMGAISTNLQKVFDAVGMLCPYR